MELRILPLWGVLLAVACAALACATEGHAQVVYAPQPLYTDPVPDDAMRWISAGDSGGAGILQTRSARFFPDGMFDVGYSFVNPYKRYYFNLVYFPWLEATFRYTEVRNQLYSNDPAFSGNQSYKDRGADLKFRLSEERRWLPAMAVGFQDMLGTGLFAGEYAVASKRWADFDFSFGIGWGKVA